MILATIADTARIMAYKPPQERTALALHLADTHVKGVTQVDLFAAIFCAARTHEAIGFGQVRGFTIVNYNTPKIAND